MYSTFCSLNRVHTDKIFHGEIFIILACTFTSFIFIIYILGSCPGAEPAGGQGMHHVQNVFKSEFN